MIQNSIIQNDAAKKQVNEALNNASDSLARIEGERELIKEIINKLNEDFSIEKKNIRKMIRTFHKQNFEQEVEEHNDFQSIYKTITSGVLK